MIQIDNLVKAYHGFRAVDGLTLTVGRGDILGLVGPNGAGKTTTLRCLAGIIPPTSGRVLIAGFEIREQPIEARKRLAFVPDEPYLFDHLAVWDWPARCFIPVRMRVYITADGTDLDSDGGGIARR